MQTSLLLEANSLAARRWAKQFHFCNMIRAASVATSSPPLHSPLHGRCYSIYRDSIHFHLQTSNKKGIIPTSPTLVTRHDKTRHFRPIRFLSSASSSFSSSSPTSNDYHQGIHLSPTQTTLALSVHFKHPALGMKDFEILSRASAFLINVDPLSPDNNRGVDNTTVQNTQDRGIDVKDEPNNDSPSTIIPPDSNTNTNTNYPHLTQNQTLRQKLLHRQNYAYEPAGGPRRFPHQLNWLEFCPNAFRPKVHVVASSHVLSPWLWPKYYGQDWLRVLKDESEGGAGGEGFVRYSLEVWGDTASGGGRDGNDGGGWIGHDGKLEGVYKPLAKFALNPYPIHHPQGMDVAVIHLKQEDTALKHLTSLGIHPLNLPTMHEFQSSTDSVFHPDERVLFQGYEVYEANMADEQELPSSAKSTTNQQKQHQNRSSSEEDERTFHPYSSLGNISMASPDRFLAKTKGGPLPEGLCGGPVIQLTDPKTGEDIPLTTANTNTMEKKHKIITPLNLRGVVEGIVPINHEDSRLAGLASFLPSYRIREFVDFAERVMLQQIVPEELFERVVALKKQESVKNTVYRGGVGNELREEGKYDDDASADGEGKLSGEQVEEDEDGASPKHPFVEGFGESEHTPELDREYQEILASLSQKHSPEEVDAILATVEAERKEVIEIMEREGGDLDDVIARVRKQTYERKDKILEELQKEIEQGMWAQRGSVQEGEIVSSRDHDSKK